MSSNIKQWDFVTFSKLELIFVIVHFAHTFCSAQNITIRIIAWRDEESMTGVVAEEANCKVMPVQHGNVISWWCTSSTGSYPDSIKTNPGEMNVVQVKNTTYGLKLLCTSDCPIQWKFYPGKDKIPSDLLEEFNVHPMRKAANVLDNGTYTYASLLTIDRNYAEATGTYKCHCISNESRQDSMFIYWWGWGDSLESNVLLNADEYFTVGKAKDSVDPWLGLGCGTSRPNNSTRLYAWVKNSGDDGLVVEIKANQSIVRDHAHGFKINVDELLDPYSIWICAPQNIDVRDLYSNNDLLLVYNIVVANPDLTSTELERNKSESTWLEWEGKLAPMYTTASLNYSSCCRREPVNDEQKQNLRRVGHRTSTYFSANEATSEFVAEFFTPKQDGNVVVPGCVSQAVYQQEAKRNEIRTVRCTSHFEPDLSSRYYLTLKGETRPTKSFLEERFEDVIHLEAPRFVNESPSGPYYFEGEPAGVICTALLSRFAEGIQWILQWENGTMTPGLNVDSTIIDKDWTVGGAPGLYKSVLKDPVRLNLTTIMCAVPEWKTEMWVTKSVFDIIVKESRKPEILEISDTSILEYHLGDTTYITMTCRFGSIGTTKVQWRSSQQDNDTVEVEPLTYPRYENWTISEDRHSIGYFRLRVVGNYTCHVTNSVGSAAHIFIIRHKDYAIPSIINTDDATLHFQTGDTNKSLECRVYGDPVPVIFWTKNDNPYLEFGNVTALVGDLIFEEISQATQGIYKCHAVNVYGNATKVYSISVSKPIIIPVLSTLAVTGTLILSAIVLTILLRKYRRKSAALEGIKDKFIKGYMGGAALDIDGLINPAAIPYDQTCLEISRKDFTLGTRIGSGEFGTISCGVLRSWRSQKKRGFYRLPMCTKIMANYKQNFSSKLVAVKHVREFNDGLDEPICGENQSADEAAEVEIEKKLRCLESLLFELKILIYIKKLGPHPNIIHSYGACTRGIDNMNVFIIMELCRDENLQKYLVNHRPCVVEEGQTLDIITNHQLSKWCYEIAEGMSYLSCNKIVHLDLACRNILLTMDNVAKISDFGLSRRLYSKSEYKKKRMELLPFAWMSIEALTANLFSVKSDVWSFGVTIWEIYSFGTPPNYGCPDERIHLALIKGNRLQKPTACSDESYKIMQECWDIDVTRRPDFAAMAKYFADQCQNLDAGHAGWDARDNLAQTEPEISSDSKMQEPTTIVIQPDDIELNAMDTRSHYHLVGNPLQFVMPSAGDESQLPDNLSHTEITEL